MSIAMDAAEHIANFVRKQLSQRARPNGRPLIVGMQGPQGAGKTTVTNRLISSLASGSSPSRAVAISLDDFYLDHPELVATAEKYPSNKLLNGRGHPGTHDVTLLTSGLKQLQSCTTDKDVVGIPVFDKSLFNGQGGRLESEREIKGPIDVVLLEGWCMGFRPLSEESIVTLRQQTESPSESSTRPHFMKHSLEDLLQVNKSLKEHDEGYYDMIDCFVQLHPQEINYVFEWRLQAEHAMKKSNCGKGMTDEAVQAFVERYMPGYEVWGKDATTMENKWKGVGQRLNLGRQREILGVEYF
ncbi:unnamed protein product [Sympodiomycopsis kandeliae]